MNQLITLDDLCRILVDCAGLPEDAGTEISLDADLTEIGYDSLALLETAARLKQEYSVVISDEEILELSTPRAILDKVNRSTTATV